MKFIKRKSVPQSSMEEKIPKKSREKPAKSFQQLQSDYAVDKMKEYQYVLIDEIKDIPIKSVQTDANIKNSILALRDRIGDPDTDPALKPKDVLYSYEVMKTKIPPKEQVLSGFELTPIPTQFGMAYPSEDGTQAWIVNRDGVWLSVDFQPNENVKISTSDVIKQYMNFDGNFAQFKKELSAITPSSNSINQGLAQIIVQENAAGNLKKIEKAEVKEDCKMSNDWRTILFWKLVMDFEANLDLTRLVIMWFLKPIEEMINLVFDGIRNLGFGIHVWFINFDWYPFKWLPVITWWEKVLWFFAVKEYEVFCSFMKFKRNMTLGTDRASKYFLEQVFAWKETIDSDKLDIEQRKYLAALQLGYNQYGKHFVSEYQIKNKLGNVLR